jgi:ABC-type branched-subunit amino acid transport system substrate-binding protein
MRGWTKRVGVATLGLSLLAAACGGGDSDTSSTANTVDQGVAQGVGSALGSSTTQGGTATTVKQPESMDDWEALWTKEREAIVQKIKDNGWGKSADGTKLTGPEGFTIDLSKCPAGWSDTEGLTDNEIRIGQTISQSGTTADYGWIPKAISPMFEYYSNKGAFTDSLGKNRHVNYIVKDDGYDAARTIPLTDELIDSEKVFAVWTLGSANALKTYDKLNQRCIPQPLVMSGHPAWGDPVNHPWTTGMQMAYNTEAVLWGGFIEQHLNEFPDGIKVASLITNNDFGKAYDSAFKAFVNESPHKDKINYFSEVIEPQTPSIKDPMTTLTSKNPDVYIVMATGVPCTQSITEAAENGLRDSAKYLFMSSVCQSSGFVGKGVVGGDGQVSDGWLVAGGGAKDFTSDGSDNDVWIKWGRDLIGAKGIDYKASGSLGSGVYFGWSMIQALQIAGQLDGGLTRSNLILTLRSMDMSHPYLVPGVKFNMNGNSDAYLVEGSTFARYDYKLQGWVSQGDAIDLSGKSSPCSWDQSVGACK